jgi:hypothetical protein
LPVSFSIAPLSASIIGSVSHPAGDRPSHPNLINAYRRSALHASNAALFSDLFHQRVEGQGHFGFNDATSDRPRLVFPTRHCIENLLINIRHTRTASDGGVGLGSVFLEGGIFRKLLSESAP